MNTENKIVKKVFLLKTQKTKKSKTKCQLHPVFPGGHPSKY